MRDFISNIDDVNLAIRELEAKLGIPHSEFIELIDVANARVEELEGQTGRGAPMAKPIPASLNPSAPPVIQVPPLKVSGLQRAIAANQGIRTAHDVPPVSRLQRAIAANGRRQPKQ